MWGNPRDNFYDGPHWIEQQLEVNCKIDLGEFRGSDKYDESELKRLILETEFRLCVCNKARSKLIKLCVSAYNLDKGLFADFG